MTSSAASETDRARNRWAGSLCAAWRIASTLPPPAWGRAGGRVGPLAQAWRSQPPRPCPPRRGRPRGPRARRAHPRHEKARGRRPERRWEAPQSWRTLRHGTLAGDLDRATSVPPPGLERISACPPARSILPTMDSRTPRRSSASGPGSKPEPRSRTKTPRSPASSISAVRPGSGRSRRSASEALRSASRAAPSTASARASRTRSRRRRSTRSRLRWSSSMASAAVAARSEAPLRRCRVGPPPPASPEARAPPPREGRDLARIAARSLQVYRVRVCSTESWRWAATCARSSERIRSARSAARFLPSRQRNGARIRPSATMTTTAVSAASRTRRGHGWKRGREVRRQPRATRRRPRCTPRPAWIPRAAPAPRGWAAARTRCRPFCRRTGPARRADPMEGHAESGQRKRRSTSLHQMPSCLNASSAESVRSPAPTATRQSPRTRAIRPNLATGGEPPSAAGRAAQAIR